MKLPKFLLADNSEFEEAVFIVHTEYPRFVFNLTTDEIEWFDLFEESEKEVLESEVQDMIEKCYAFYDSEISKYDTT